MLSLERMKQAIAAGGSVIHDGRILTALHEVEAIQAGQPAPPAPVSVPTPEPTPPAWSVEIGQLSWQGENARAMLTCRTEPGPQSNGEVEAAIRRVVDFMLRPAQDEVAEALEAAGHLMEYRRLLRVLADAKRAGDAEVIARARTQVRAFRGVVMRLTEGKAAAVAKDLEKDLSDVATGEELTRELSRLLARLLASREVVKQIATSPNTLIADSLMRLERDHGFASIDVA